MKQNEKYKLSEKFWEGETSLTEEKTFLDHNIQNHEMPADELYVKYVSKQKNESPDLSELVWTQISRKNNFRRRTLYAFSVAASFLLVVVSIMILELKKSQNHEADFALLEQTLKHVSNGIDPESKSAINILYEDDMIVIVSDNSN